MPQVGPASRCVRDRRHDPRAQVSRRRRQGELGRENLAALEKGIVNLERHVNNVPPPLRPAVRRRDQPFHRRHRRRDRAAEETDGAVRRAGRALARTGPNGGAGAEDVANAVIERDRTGREPVPVRLRRRRCRCGRRCGRSRPRSTALPMSRPMPRCATQIARLQEDGYGRYPVCVAKTQYSFSTDAKLRGAPSGHSRQHPRGAAGRRRRVRRHDLRRHDDDAGAAEGPGGRDGSTSPMMAGWWDCSDGARKHRPANRIVTITGDYTDGAGWRTLLSGGGERS